MHYRMVYINDFDCQPATFSTVSRCRWRSMTVARRRLASSMKNPSPSTRRNALTVCVNDSCGPNGKFTIAVTNTRDTRSMKNERQPSREHTRETGVDRLVRSWTEALKISMTELASAPRRDPTHNARSRSCAGELRYVSREGNFSSLCYS